MSRVAVVVHATCPDCAHEISSRAHFDGPPSLETVAAFRELLVGIHRKGCIAAAAVVEPEFDVDDVDHDDGDLGGCPYFARYHRLEGFDDGAVCMQLGVCEAAGEPQCVTCEPNNGWPSRGGA